LTSYHPEAEATARRQKLAVLIYLLDLCDIGSSIFF
jgi:hypothetical protein